MTIIKSCRFGGWALPFAGGRSPEAAAAARFSTRESSAPGTARLGTALSGTALSGTALSGTARHGTALSGPALSCPALSSPARFGTAQPGPPGCSTRKAPSPRAEALSAPPLPLSVPPFYRGFPATLRPPKITRNRFESWVAFLW